MMLFMTAFAMGLAFCGPPGAVFAMAARRGAARGFSAALMVEFGSLVGDAVWAVVGLSGAGILMQIPVVQGLVGTAGAALLAWLGFLALRDAWQNRQPAAAPSSVGNDFVTGAVLSLTNPQAVAYWIAFGASIQVIIGHAAAFSEFAVFFGGFMIACVVYCFAASAIIAGARRLLTDRLYRIVNAVCGAALVGFAIFLFYDAHAALMRT
jgi:chemosensory pili system protein ChpE